LGFGFDGLCLALLEGNVCGGSLTRKLEFCCGKAALFFTLFVLTKDGYLHLI